MTQEKEREVVRYGWGGEVSAKGWTCKELDIEQKAENQWWIAAKVESEPCLKSWQKNERIVEDRKGEGRKQQYERNAFTQKTNLQEAE